MRILLQEGRGRYLMYGSIFFLVSATVGFGLFPVIYPAMFPERCEVKARKFYVFMLYLLLVMSVGVAYTVTMREDFERGAIPRTHLRYVCHLFMPFMIVFFHQTRSRERMTAKKIAQAFLRMVCIVYFICCFWLGPLNDGIGDHTILIYLCGISQDEVLFIMFGWGALLLIGVLMFNRRPAAVLCLYIAVIGGIQLYNNAIWIERFRDMNRVDEAVYKETENIRACIEEYDDGNILFISDGLTDTQRIFDTYLNQPNMYTVNANDYIRVQTDQGVDLSEQKLDTAASLHVDRKYDLKNVDCLILSSKYQLLSDEPELKRVNGEIGYKIYDMKHATVLPPIKSCWDVQSGECVIDIFPTEFSSKYEIKDGKFISTDRPDMLVFGPYRAFPAGKYDFEYRYHCEEEIPEGTRLGYVDLRDAGGVDLSAYEKDFYAGQESVKLENVQIPVDCTKLEIRMYTEAAGVVADQIVIVRKEEPSD